jgi:hypothetical protein
MKQFYTLLAVFLLTATTWAQSPEKMNYQAVVRDVSDALVQSQAVGMQISILQGSASGTAVYSETQTATTNVNGLLSIEIGAGTTSDDFTTIDWATGTYFIKTETDPTGGTNFSITGTSQLLSVPYALYANTSSDTEAVAANTAKVGYTEALVSANTDVAANTLKVSYTQPIFNVNTFYAELGGYVIQISPSVKHGLVAAMQDQGSSDWYEANDLLSDPDNHDAARKEFLDWRLPTKREFNKMYLFKNDIGGFGNAFYWSSTEGDSVGAWEQDFGDGFQDYYFKFNAFNVRAVRAF